MPTLAARLTALGLTLLPAISQAQGPASFNTYHQFNDTLVAQFNRGNFRAMEAFSSPALKQTEPAGSMSKYLAALQPKVGRIKATAILAERGKSHIYEWKGEKQNLRVTLIAPAPGVLDDYIISDFIAQPQPRPTAALSDNRRKTTLDELVHRAATIYLQHPEAVGLSLGVYWQGRQYRYHYGETAKGTSRLPTDDTYYDPGSVAKTVVGALLAQAVLDRKVQLTDDIRRYFPGKYPNLEFQGHPVRFLDLANHTSGLPSAPRSYSGALQDSLRRMSLTRRLAYYNQYSADSLLSDLRRVQLTSEPGTAYRYNGFGMKLLQLLLERIYHQPYEQLFTTYLKTHYGMAATKRVLSVKEQARYATGYDEKSQPQPHPNYTGYWGGPVMSTTLPDLLSYARAQVLEKEPAIQLSHQRTWGTAPGFGIGLSWMLDTDNEGFRRIYHDGHFPGFNARLVTYPGQDLAFVVLVNDNISQSRLTELTNLLKLELPRPVVK